MPNHQPSRRQLLATTSVLSMMSLFHGASWAQVPAWPAITKITVPLPPGGGIDIAARRLGELLAPKLGTSVVVDNKLGASGLIAAKAVAAGPADGSNIFYMHSGLITVQAITGRLDILADFKAVTKLNSGPHLLVVSSSSPYTSQAELLAAIKAKPGQLNFGSGGPGSPTHLAVEWLDERVPGGLKATHVPFKSAAEAMVALIGGDIDFAFQLPATAAEHIKSGKLRALSTSGIKRLPFMPNLPTVAEAGVPGYAFDAWAALMVPAKTPDAVVARLADAVKAAAAMPEFTALMARMGGLIETSASPAALTEQLRTAIAEEKKLVVKLGLKAD